MATDDATPILLEDDELETAEKLRAGCKRLLGECGKVIVGQEQVLEQLLIAVLAKGHCLLVGVPGLAKTLMIRTLADGMNLSFNRVQFTPDLMPTDITGTEILYDDKNSGQRAFRFVHGPIFANIVLADEINRTPPKTQAALLEAMQERQVTVAGQRHKLPDPFFVLATQNPIEQEGTYPLPEAQQDRFMFNIKVDYPAEAEEEAIIATTTSGDQVGGAAGGVRRRNPGDAGVGAEGAGRQLRDPLRVPADPRQPHGVGRRRRSRTSSRSTSPGVPARGPGRT